MATNPVASLKFPLGADNRSREYEVPAGAARAVVNLDVTREGGLLCRKGVRHVFADSCHSLYPPPHGAFLLLARAGNLCRMTGAGECVTLAPVAGTVRYATLDGVTYWTDGVSVGCVQRNGTAAPWGLPTPPLPFCAAGSEGGLTGGRYQVTMTAIHPSGLESGAAEPAVLTVPPGGGLTVTVPVGPAEFRFAVYLTPPHGERHEFRLAALLASGDSTTIGAHEPGRRLESLLAMRPPAASCLASYRGRLWMASGEFVWFTSERSPHWVFPRDGYFLFESPVTLLGPAENGLYVGLADATYFLEGSNPAQMTRRLATRLGALPGGGQPLPADAFLGQGEAPAAQCGWWDSDGAFCVGRAGGLVGRPAVARHTVSQAVSASGAFRQHEGLRQWVAVVDRAETGDSSLTATDTALTEFFSHGTPLESPIS